MDDLLNFLPEKSIGQRNKLGVTKEKHREQTIEYHGRRYKGAGHFKNT